MVAQTGADRWRHHPLKIERIASKAEVSSPFFVVHFALVVPEKRRVAAQLAGSKAVPYKFCIEPDVFQLVH